MKRIIIEYVEYTKKSIKLYMKKILESHYDPIIVEEFLKTYINVRYYNVSSSVNKRKSFYIKIIDEINYKYDILLKKYNEKAKKEKITIDIREKKRNQLYAIKELYLLLIYWDNVIKINSEDTSLIKKSMYKVVSIRSKYLKIKKNELFAKELYNMIKQDLIKKEIYLENLKSDIFYLSLKKGKRKSNMYYVTLENKIKFPMIYSEGIINKIMNDDIIQEDILKVEFTLLSIVIIQDLIKGNFADVYISNLPESLLKKKHKLFSVLKSIDTQLLQDKIYIKIMYEDYEKYTNSIKECVSLGYKFVIELDKYFVDVDKMNELQLFKYVFVTKNTKVYKEIMAGNKYNNILEK